MEPEIEPADQYCAGRKYLLTAQCDGLIGEWKVAVPNGINPASVIFDSPNNPISYVTFPSEGLYSPWFECCQ